MKKKRYDYNPELAKPQGSINCNRNNPVIAWKEKRSIKRNKRETADYLPPQGLRRRKGYYLSYDQQEIPFDLMENQQENGGLVPCIVYFHGGGFMMPLQEMMLRNAAFYTKQTGYKVVLPEYRYAPAVPCKTTIEDCFYMVVHILKYGRKYGIDPEKVIIYGESAGGALAAGVTHLMRDRGIDAAAGQMLIYPATDYHSEKYVSMETYQYAVWPKKSNIFMWKYYLKGAEKKVKQYAAPINMPEFVGLPPAYVEPQEVDVLRDEGIAYANKLKEAGSLVELNVIPGSYHGFDWDHSSPLVQRILMHRCEVMQNFFIRSPRR